MVFLNIKLLTLLSTPISDVLTVNVFSFLRFMLFRKCEYSNSKYCFRSVKFHNTQKRKVVLEEEIIEDENEEPTEKQQKIENEADPLIESVPKEEVQKTSSVTNKTNTWNRSVGVMSRKNLTGLVKIKKTETEVTEKSETEKPSSSINKLEMKNNDSLTNSSDVKSVPVPETSNGLSLLGAYSGSDSNDSD